MTRLTLALVIAAATASAAAAQGDARFCASYAANMAGVGDLAVKKNPACLDYSKGVHGNYQSHFDWCMRTPAGDVQGADAYIRRLVAACTGNAPPPKPAAPAASAAPPTSGAEEPFGEKIGIWRFTQAPDKARVICRAYSGENIIGRFGDGRYRLSVVSKGLPKETFEGANLHIAGRDEPANVRSDGSRIYFEVGDDEIGRLVRSGGFRWRAWNRDGSATFDGSLGAAIARLRECTKANGGR